MQNMAGRGNAPEFNWADTPRKNTSEAFRDACVKMAGDQRALAFMAAWATDSVLYNGAIASTRLDMTSGQQKLIKNSKRSRK